MKTAISLPDHAAEHVDRVARRHGMTRSEFYRRAAEQYADELANADQSNRYNASRISTVVVLPITSNTALARHPGNVFVPAAATGLPKDSVINVSQPMTVDRTCLDDTDVVLPDSLMGAVDAGLRRVMDL